jgi:hypothetical protein
VRQYNMVMSPAGPGSKIDCACEVQYQFIKPELSQLFVSLQPVWTKHATRAIAIVRWRYQAMTSGDRRLRVFCSYTDLCVIRLL